MKINYNEMMLNIIDKLDKVPKLLLHSCCGPCSTSVIARLTPYFDITIIYYNPNIEPFNEYEKRKNEQIRFINEYQGIKKINYLDIDYLHEDFVKMAKGLETEPEGGARCTRCYELRIYKTALIAQEQGFDYFGTTLTVSPYKHADIINQIGEKISKELNIKYLYSDFKKQDGYKESIELAKKYNLYRQNYCGCHFSQTIGIEE